MNADFQQLLWVLGIGATVGVPAGLALRRLRPDWCTRLSRLAHAPKSWWIYLVGFLLFGAMAYSEFSQANVPLGTFAALFSLVELACLFWVRLSAAPPRKD